MYLKPVSVSMQPTPKCSAIRFCRSVVTNVLMMTAFLRLASVRITLRDEPRAAVIGHDRADLVAGEQDHLPAGIAHGHAHAVGVGIGRQDDVGVLGFRLLDREFQRLGILGIRRFHRRETAIARACASTME